jgi:hypothetical protein
MTSTFFSIRSFDLLSPFFPVFSFFPLLVLQRKKVMASHSPHPTSLSPQVKTATAFHWPIPGSPSHLKPITHYHHNNNNNNNMNELSVKEILERYNEDPELMKYILTAKSEEDKVNIKLWLS